MWDSLPRKRRKPVDDRPPIKPGPGQHSNSTSVYCELRRLLAIWRGDPEKLAVACSAMALAGYPDNTILWDVADAGGAPFESKAISDDEARELITRALRGRQHDLLRARGEGLLMAIEELAQAAEAHRLHEIQVDVAVIECRVLDIDERLALLRQMESVPTS